MPDFTLFVAPGSCARVPTIALEEIGVPYETRLIKLPLNEQTSPEFLAINPKGKVPALLVDGVPLTENVAILTWLNKTFPGAGLLPGSTSDFDAAQQVADLAMVSGTLHPIVTRAAMPAKFLPKGGDLDAIRATAIDAMQPLMTMIDTRLSKSPWWYGEEWTILDAYLNWVWWRLAVTGYPGDAFPHVADHAERVHQRPSVVRAMASENAYARAMRAEGLFVPHTELD